MNSEMLAFITKVERWNFPPKYDVEQARKEALELIKKIEEWEANVKS